MAHIIQLSVSHGGLPKRPVKSAFCGRLGLEGDAHAHPSIHGGPLKAVLLIASEVVDWLAAQGYPVFPGALGENITSLGIDIQALRIGDRLRAGLALLEVTQPRGPCSQLDVYGPSIKDAIFDDEVRRGNPASPRWGLSGFYMIVLEEAEIQCGDTIELLS